MIRETRQHIKVQDTHQTTQIALDPYEPRTTHNEIKSHKKEYLETKYIHSRKIGMAHIHKTGLSLKLCMFIVFNASPLVYIVEGKGPTKKLGKKVGKVNKPEYVEHRG